MSDHVLDNADAQIYLALGIGPREVVRLAWPDADDDQADLVLWEFTPFPLVTGIHDLVAADQHNVLALAVAVASLEDDPGIGTSRRCIQRDGPQNHEKNAAG